MLHTQPPARPAPSQPSHLPPSSPSSSSPPTTVDLVPQPGGTSPVKSAPKLGPNATSNQTVPDTSSRRPGTANSSYDGSAYVNRWSESTASSGRSSHAPETHSSGPDVERGLSKTPTEQTNRDLNNNTNHNANNNPDDQLSGRKTPTSALRSTNGNTATFTGQESGGIPALPQVSTSASGPSRGDNSGSFNDLDFFGNRTATLSPTATAPRGDGPLMVREEHPMTATTNESMQESPQDPNARHRHSDNHDRERRPRGSSQKTVLSRALQKANTAVLLDNAMNYEGAIEAYMDACGLLQQVMMRTSGGEERQKLQEIRSTYTTRINELRRLGLSGQSDGKALPERPLSDDSLSGSILSPPLDPEEDDDFDDEQHVYEVATATSARVLGNVSQPAEQMESRSLPPSQIPPRRQSLLPSPFDGESRHVDSGTVLHERTRSNSFGRERQLHSSPKKPSSPLPPIPQTQTEIPALPSQPISQFASSDLASSDGHAHSRGLSNGSTSWLDTIDESGVSSDGSVRSNSPTVYLRSRHDRVDSRGTEAEFDAALDAAVEAAYDEGYEPDQSVNLAPRVPVSDGPVSNVRMNIELAKQRVREAEREARALSAKERDQRRIQEEALHGDFSAIDSHYEDYEAEEEERILEEMMDDFDFDMQSKSALPRQSGSSGFSGRTASSSVPSNFTTAGTPLSTLAEEDVLPPSDMQEAKPTFPPLQNLPPSSALPPPPSSPPPPVSASNSVSPGTQAGPSVRERRLSGRNPKELVIETDTKLPAGSEAPRTMPSTMLGTHAPSPFPQDEPKTSIPSSWKVETKNATNSAEKHPFASSESLPLQSPVAAGITKTLSHESGSGAASTQSSVGKPLYSHHDTVLPSSRIRPSPRPIQISIPSDGPGHVPNTPATGRPELGRAPTFSSLATQAAHNFFDTDIHSPTNLGYPNPSVPDPPMPLEACPQSFLLRPFWLMRCLYQTITHSRGAYVTTKLFIPSDVWRVRNVKIRALDEKISSCDLLTAALLKLAAVDMFDADAVLEEMQTLEAVLDQVQTVLTKKLGSEVGVQGAMGLFKMAEGGSPMSDQPSGRSSSASGRSYLSSWRKLRSKSSGTSSVPSQIGARDGSARDTMTLHSLPMTEAPGTYAARQSVTQLQCTGPNANYMSALARLFDAAQVIDQIARQVEDPGLRHSSQTLVGLELSTRHAAEFFGFYICRFVLNDVGLMLDKFIKRSGEWITS